MRQSWDGDGMWMTCFAASMPDRPVVEFGFRHRLRARPRRGFGARAPAPAAAAAVLDRVRAVRFAGLRDLCLQHTGQIRIWVEVVRIALGLLVWMSMFALTGQGRYWVSRRLWFRLFFAAGQLVTIGWRRILRLIRHESWTGGVTGALERLVLLPNPG
ncbi:hypothetical protein ACWDAO_33555 [Streptomyces sp. NPDC001212]